MKSNKGFTLIECFVVAIIILTIGFIIAPIIVNRDSVVSGKVTWGVNGCTEVRCIEGYKFIVGNAGRSTQIMDEYGKGLPCK